MNRLEYILNRDETPSIPKNYREWMDDRFAYWNMQGIRIKGIHMNYDMFNMLSSGQAFKGMILNRDLSYLSSIDKPIDAIGSFCEATVWINQNIIDGQMMMALENGDTYCDIPL